MKDRPGVPPLFMGRLGVLVLVTVLALTLGAVPSAHAVNGGTSRTVFCAHGFSLSSYGTFSFEPFEPFKGKAPRSSDYNGLTEGDWAQVRHALAAEMEARGYRQVEKGGQLLLSCGAFPPIDLAHPVTGLFVKFRTGSGLLDLTKWSGGAMTDGPYTAATLVDLVGPIARQIPASLADIASRPNGS